MSVDYPKVEADCTMTARCFGAVNRCRQNSVAWHDRGRIDDKERFVDSGGRFGLNGSGTNVVLRFSRRGGEGPDAADDRKNRRAPGRDIDAGLCSAGGEWRCARLRVRPDRAWLRSRLQ